MLDNFYGNQETVVTSVAERLLAAFPAQDSAHKHYATKPPRATSTREKFAGWALAMREVSNSDRTGVQEGRPTSTFRLKRVTRKEQKAIPRLKKLQHHMVWMKQMKVEEGQMVMAYLCNQHLPPGMRSNRRQVQRIRSRGREGPKGRFARPVPC